eukprot:scaffold34349_cov57-Phaeocystis_antarctica.AAC.2
MGSGKSLQAPGCQVHWHTHCELCAVCALHSLKTHCKYTRMQSTLYMFTLSLGVVAVRWLQPLLHTGIRLRGAGVCGGCTVWSTCPSSMSASAEPLKRARSALST